MLWLETMYAMEELEAAIDAVKDIGLPVCATMSFDTAGKTMMGITPSNLAKRSQDLNLIGFWRQLRYRGTRPIGNNQRHLKEC